jgi:hypothetical protein
VISTRLFAGNTQIHVFNPEHPGGGFEPVPADLEDVYFHTLKEADPDAAAKAA